METQVIVTPKVKAAVRKHFNCSSAKGAELENEGAAGSKG